MTVTALRRTLLACFAVVCTLVTMSGTNAVAAARLNNRVVCKVNQDLIMQSDIERFQRRVKRIGGSDASAPRTSDVLEALLDAQLLRQFSAGRGYVPTESEISDKLEAQMADFRKLFPTVPAFEKAMKSAGYTEELLREDLRSDIRVDMQVQQAIGTKFRMSDSDVNAWIDLQKKAGRATEELHVCRIAVAFGDDVGVSREDATAQLKEYAAKIKGDNLGFTEGLKKYIPQEAVKSGHIFLDDYGETPVNKLSSKVVSACKGVEPMKWTSPVVTGNAVSIFYVMSRRDAKSIVFEKRYSEAREALLRDLRRKARVLIYAPEFRKDLPENYRPAYGNPDVPKSQ